MLYSDIRVTPRFAGSPRWRVAPASRSTRPPRTTSTIRQEPARIHQSGQVRARTDRGSQGATGVRASVRRPDRGRGVLALPGAHARRSRDGGPTPPLRLPNRLGACCIVSDRFYIKPLLRTVTFPQTAYVLALAEGSVRLIEVTADQPPTTVDVPGLPKDAASYAGVRSLGRTPPGRVNGRVQGDEGRKLRVREYARAIDHELRSVLTGGTSRWCSPPPNRPRRSTGP